jgi:hypothetical protein
LHFHPSFNAGLAAHTSQYGQRDGSPRRRRHHDGRVRVAAASCNGSGFGRSTMVRALRSLHRDALRQVARQIRIVAT